MRAYCDNDVIHKLASCDLLAEATRVLAADEVVVLATAKFKFSLNNKTKGEKKYGAPTFARIKTFIEAATELTEMPDEMSLSAFEGAMNIDPGEQLLFAAASHHKAALLTTGDKRALEALATNQQCSVVAQSLHGRIVCFEQVLRRVCDSEGFDEVVTRISSALSCDSMLGIVFRDGVHTKEANALAGLDSYINDLRTKTGDLLAP